MCQTISVACCMTIYSHKKNILTYFDFKVVTAKKRFNGYSKPYKTSHTELHSTAVLSHFIKQLHFGSTLTWNIQTKRQYNTTQCNSTQDSHFSKKKLAASGRTRTHNILGKCSTNWATEAAQLAGSNHTYKATQLKAMSQPDDQVTSYLQYIEEGWGNEDTKPQTTYIHEILRPRDFSSNTTHNKMQLTQDSHFSKNMSCHRQDPNPQYSAF